MEQWRESRGSNWPALLKARAALIDAAGELVDGAAQASRGMTATERGSFDEHSAQVREINASPGKVQGGARCGARRGPSTPSLVAP